jgi:hypothetical protein
MKSFYTIVLLLLLSNLTIAQNKVQLNITGIAPSTEKKMLPSGDMISYWTGDKGEGYQNMRVQVKGANGMDKFFTVLDAAPDKDGHYTINHQVEITDGPKFSLDEELELLVFVETIFGNVIWTKVTRNKTNFSDPIILDHYTAQQGRTTPPRKRLILNYYFIGGNNGIEEKVKANDDGWDDRHISDFRFMLKNVGDTEWKVDKVFDTGQNVFRRNVRVGIQFTGICPIHLNDQIVMRVEMKTEKGNLLWHEAELEPRGLKKLYYSTHYTIAGEEDETTNNNSTNGEEEDKPDTNTNDEQPDTNANKDKPELNSSMEGAKPKTGPAQGGASKPKGDQGAATDLTTKTVSAICADMAKGDTLINVNGSSVCVRGFKPEGAKAMAGILAMDCNFEMNGTVFPIQGGKRVKCNKTDGQLVEGILRANTVYNSEAGAVTLKEGTLVVFKAGKLIAGTLAENGSLKVGNTAIECAPNAALDGDIRFDVQGKLVECSLAAETVWDAQIELKFPKMSRLVFKNGELNRVICSEASSFELNGTTFYAQPNKKQPAYSFDKGTLAEITAGKGNSIKIAETNVAVEEGSRIKFALNNGTYEVEKFFTAEEVKLNVPKGNSTKEVTVKAGKKVVLSGGKVVKAG